MNPRLRPTLPLWPDFDPKITHFWGPRVHNWSMAMAKTASNQLGICPWKMHARPMRKVSIFMAVTAKKVTEKAQKQAKMARFRPKTGYNGRVMARKIFFYQCQWVTKFCAKFGRSRIPRRASIPNSFIVLRCMWKEPAPFWSDENCWWQQLWWQNLGLRTHRDDDPLAAREHLCLAVGGPIPGILVVIFLFNVRCSCLMVK